jgi:D-glycero-alpha-D-manno-heptose-7-phosphate kinase
VRASARCRVDLAGGTLDIWPLGLLHRPACTVNLAIDLPVAVEMARREAGWAFESELGAGVVANREALAAEPETALLGLVAAELDLPPAAVRWRSGSPRGAGLGASSALTVALLAAGQKLLGHEREEPARLAARARDLEARLMGLPTGMQDHLPALLGGALALHHEPGGTRIERLAVDLERLGASLHLFYTGVSHFSAGNNWRIVRARLDGDPAVTERLERIARTAEALADALRAGDLEEVGRLAGEEWRARRELAPGISTPEIEAILAATAAAGAWGGKACGAGGGGCVAVGAPARARARVEAAGREAGGEVLAAPPVARGLELDATGAPALS